MGSGRKNADLRDENWADGVDLQDAGHSGGVDVAERALRLQAREALVVKHAGHLLLSVVVPCCFLPL